MGHSLLQFMSRNAIFRYKCPVETMHSTFNVLAMDNVLFDFMKQVIAVSFLS